MAKRFLGEFVGIVVAVVVLASAWLTPGAALAQPPTATMSFAPDPIGERTVSTLTIAFVNSDPVTPASDLAITHTLPAELRIASLSNASTDCTNAILSAPEGGSTIALSEGRIGASSTCTLTVDVTGDTPGTFNNVSGDVTSSAGNGGSATADLTISATAPVFEMTFLPTSVPVGGTSTVTYSIENRLPSSSLQTVSFRNVLPEGMVVASPANVSTSCDTTFGPPLTAQPGATEINFQLAVLGAGVTCETSVDVTASVAGALGNTTEPLMYSDPQSRTSGKASAVLDVTVDLLNLAGFFSGDPVPPGGSLFLDFTIDNFNRDFAATGISFSNDLDAALSGLVALGLPMTDVCGSGSTVSGTSNLSLTGGNLPAGGTCSFRVEVQVPGTAAPGVYTNTSDEVTADIDGRTVTGSRAVDSFEVNEAPVLEKIMLVDPLPAGEFLDIEFTITSISSTSAATDIGFVDNLDQFIPGTVASTLPPSGFCGGGTIVFTNVGFDDRGLIMTGATLDPGESCAFQVTLDVPRGTASGRYLNRTEPITATVGGNAVTGQSAEAEVEFISAPQLRKSFAEPRVAPGDSVTLELELSHGENAPGDATEIMFMDELNAMLPGLQAIGLPIVDVCGSGSRLEGTSVLTFTGGTLAPLGSCAFDVTVSVPATAESRPYTNTTSEVSATVAGLPVLGAPAVASLEVTSVVLKKEFLQNPSFAGDTVPLRFTITNSNPDQPATDMFFSDDLSRVLPGLAAVGLPPAGVCGAGSTITGTGVLTFIGGDVPGDGSCTFDVDVQVPSDTEANTYTNVTSTFSFVSGGLAGSTSGASAVLNIGEPLSFAKAFDADVVAPGNTVNLEFTITNAHPTLAAEQLSFDDDLAAALEGFQAVGLPLSDVCGGGSMLTGSDVITLTGGLVAPDSSCTFSVELQVPEDVGMGASVVNETSVLTGLIGDFARAAPPARDELSVNLVSLTKQFEGPAEQGGSTMLTFTVENLNAESAATGVSFNDDLDAVLPGLAAAGTPAEDACGEGSVVDGTGVLALRNGSIDAGGSCTFSVAVEVPLAASPGDYENVTSAVSTDQGTVGGAASATLTVVPRSIEDGGVDGGTDGGIDGGVDGGTGGGCGCRTTTANEVPVWLLGGVLFFVWRWRRGRPRA